MTPLSLSLSLQSSDLSLSFSHSFNFNLTRQGGEEVARENLPRGFSEKENVATRPSAEIKRHVTYVDSLSSISQKSNDWLQIPPITRIRGLASNQSLRLRPPPFCFSLFTLHSLTPLSLSLSRIWSYIHSLSLNSQSLNQFPEVASSISVLFIQTVWSIIHRTLLAFTVPDSGCFWTKTNGNVALLLVFRLIFYPFSVWFLRKCL